ncbi:MAG: molybdenum cofactor guanylyltransferase [Deltaproteobacteria bacterium]|nr:molybdenum cofactor guanylyltransferase [Deltaproteobacteria bacterium]
MPVGSKVSNYNNTLFKDVSGVILVGGKSSRYGSNKALAKINGVPLIERVIGVMGRVFENLILITNTPDEYAHLGLPMYEDLIKGLGPIGGLYTGLAAIPDDAGFFVACDMPILNHELIHYMVKERGRYDAVVPRIKGMMEALHALYGKGCLSSVKRLIDSQEYQIIRIFNEVSVRYIDEDEIRRFDPDLKCFININKPEELKNI